MIKCLWFVGDGINEVLWYGILYLYLSIFDVMDCFVIVWWCFCEFFEVLVEDILVCNYR